MGRFFARFDAALPLAPIVLAPVILFWDVLFAGRTLYWGLPTLQFLPWRAAALESLLRGALPLWNPDNGMGAPLLANYQLALFYPPGWLIYLLGLPGGPPAMAWAGNALVVLHLVWAGLGTAKLLHDMGAGKLAQTVGGLAFGLCGYLVARNMVMPMIWAAAWLPWVVRGAHHIVTARSRWPSVGLVASLALLLLAGHAQTAWYILLFASLWLLALSGSSGGWRAALAAALCWGGAVVLAALIAAIQLVPTAEYLLQSQRSAAVDYDLGMTYSFWPWRFFTLLFPEMFGNPGRGDYWGYASFWEDAVYLGLLPVFLALSSLRRKAPGSHQKPIIRFLWAVVGVSFLLALGKNTPVFPFLYRYVPTFSMFQAPARFLLLTEFGLALLAGLALDGWRKPFGAGLRWLKRGTVIAAAVGLAGLIGLALPGFGLEPTFLRATALAGCLALLNGWLLQRQPPREETARWQRWQAGVIALLAVDLILAGAWLKPTASLSLYGKDRERLASPIPAGSDARVYLSAGDDYWLKYNRFVRFTDYRPLEPQSNIWPTLLPNTNLLAHVSSANNFDPLVPGRYARWMAAVETLPEALKTSYLRLMNVGWWERLDVTTSTGVIFQPVANPIPAYWTACAIPALSETQAWNYTWGLDIGIETNDLPSVVVLEDEPQAGCQPGAPSRVIAPEDGTYVFQSEQPGWLVIPDTWYPGWQAVVNGIEAPVLRANYLFRAVALPAGESAVQLMYAPNSFWAGLVLTLVGLLGLGLLAAAGRRQRFGGNILQNRS